MINSLLTRREFILKRVVLYRKFGSELKINNIVFNSDSDLIGDEHMFKRFGLLVFRGEVLHQHNSVFANGEQIEVLLKDGRRILGKILPAGMEGPGLNGEREMLREFCEWGA